MGSRVWDLGFRKYMGSRQAVGFRASGMHRAGFRAWLSTFSGWRLWRTWGGFMGA